MFSEDVPCIMFIKEPTAGYMFSMAEKGSSPLPCEDMLSFYIAVMRPVMEYAAPVRHCGLTAELTSSQFRNVHYE